MRNDAVETSGRPLAAVHRGLVAVIDALAAGDTQRVVLNPDGEIRFAHTGMPLEQDCATDPAIAPTVIGAAQTSRASGREAVFAGAPAEFGVS